MKDKQGQDRKKVLMVIPFESLYPPMKGGMLRCFNLLHQLCRHFDVTAIMHQDKDSFLKAIEEYPALKNAKIISTKDHPAGKDIYDLIPSKYRDAIKFRILNRSFKEPADTNYLLLHPHVKEALKRDHPDCVILEDMSILKLSKLVRRFRPGVPVIYDAYNINSSLAAEELEKGVIESAEYEIIKKTETSLSDCIDGVLTCSEQDLVKLKEMNRGEIKGTVIPNGVGIPENHQSGANFSREILFCGTLDYFPNQEGLIWFCEQVLPLLLKELPELKLIVVGKGDPGNKLAVILQNPAIVNYGKVDRVEPYYQKAAMAIIPLLSGSGTRLKLVEAMGYRTAVVSTSIGAEGINYRNGDNILIGDDAVSFARHILNLINDPQRAEEIAQNGLQLAREQYDWNVVGEKLSTYINELTLG